MPLEGKFLLVALIRLYKDNIKCDSASNAPKCVLNNNVSINQKLVKLSNTSTMLFPPVAKTLSKCLRVWQGFVS